jgi:hypothetical protein
VEFNLIKFRPISATTASGRRFSEGGVDVRGHPVSHLQLHPTPSPTPSALKYVPPHRCWLHNSVTALRHSVSNSVALSPVLYMCYTFHLFISTHIILVISLTPCLVIILLFSRSTFYSLFPIRPYTDWRRRWQCRLQCRKAMAHGAELLWEDTLSSFGKNGNCSMVGGTCWQFQICFQKWCLH